jgi:hypothetical protein
MGTNNITVRYPTVIRHVQGILDKLLKNFFHTGGSGGMSCRGEEGGEETAILKKRGGVGECRRAGRGSFLEHGR